MNKKPAFDYSYLTIPVQKAIVEIICQDEYPTP